MKLQTGDILLHKGKRWTSRIIKWFTKSPYTHVAIAYDENRIFEIDINKKLSVYKLDTSLEYEVYRVKGGLSKETKCLLRNKMIERKIQMKGYDWAMLFSLGLSKMFKKPILLDMKNHVICSEIVDMLYGEIGIDLVSDAILGHIVPSDIINSDEIECLGTINNKY